MKDTIKTIGKTIGKMLLLPLMAAALLFPVQVSAAEYSCTVELPAEVHTGGNNIPDGLEYTLTLSPTGSAPMPKTDTLTVQGGGAVRFGPITYTAPGDYEYTVRQAGGSAAHLSYDATVYTVTVRVSNAGTTAADGLTAEVWAIRDGGGEKVSAIVFTNSYNPPAPDDHPEIAQAIKDGTWGGRPTAKPAPNRLPQTGDNANPALWAVIAGIALAALAAVIVAYHRNRRG